MEVNLGEKKVIKVDAAKREIIRGLFIILLVSTVFIFLRILLKILGANPETPFTGFIYLVSGFFLLPFFGMFPQDQDALPGDHMVDTVAIIGFICYIILLCLAMGVTYVAANILKTGKKVTETVKYDNPVDDQSEIVTKVVK